VVVHNLNVIGIKVTPAKADPPPVVDPDAVLPQPVALERSRLGRGRQAAEDQTYQAFEAALSLP
jgi:hypothetical protein